ncbi:MAG TPA: hypothetical protein VLG47_02715 [Candidatus Saccharimonadales bacterium]|nr:hypothetical protein [Candidatus Saccharimonadales bacterium]
MAKASSKNVRYRQNSSRSSSKRKLFQPLEVIAIALIAIGVGFLGGHQYQGSSHAQFTSRVCNGKNWCLNRSGNGRLDGTHVLAWPNGGSNENFTMIATSIPGCGSFVQNTPKLQCPFAVGSGLNARYAGDPINEMYTDTTGIAYKCVGTDSVGKGILLPCGSGTGTYMIAHNGYFIDRYWSNVNYQTYHEYNTPSFLCGFFNQQQVQFSNSGQSGYCTWQEK